MSGVKLFRLVAWVAVAAVGGLFIGLSVSKPWQQQTVTVASSTGTAAIGGPFQLTSHRGETIDNAALAGKPYLAFFGFTHCPDVCPTTLYELSDLMNELGPVADQFNVLFFTVDPERDTQELLAQYMTAFVLMVPANEPSSLRVKVPIWAMELLLCCIRSRPPRP